MRAHAAQPSASQGALRSLQCEHACSALQTQPGRLRCGRGCTPDVRAGESTSGLIGLMRAQPAVVAYRVWVPGLLLLLLLLSTATPATSRARGAGRRRSELSGSKVDGKTALDGKGAYAAAIKIVLNWEQATPNGAAQAASLMRHALSSGELDDEQSFRAANNLGFMLLKHWQQRGDNGVGNDRAAETASLQEAIEVLRFASKLRPDHVETRQNLAVALFESGDVEVANEEMDHVEERLSSSPQSDGSGRDGGASRGSGGGGGGGGGGSDTDAASNHATMRKFQVQQYHFAMMNDVSRGEAYAKAIRGAVAARNAAGEPSNVLELGTGSGVLAMVAADAGADSVATIERNRLLSATAADIMLANGFAPVTRHQQHKDIEADHHTIHLIAKDSALVSLEEDLGGQPADIIVFELFGAATLAMHFIPFPCGHTSRILPVVVLTDVHDRLCQQTTRSSARQ
eukprot:SAG22_NODE_1042_length_5883_cov_129.108575_5_plen_458_part_00